MKQGFVLNYAFCKSCDFQIRADQGVLKLTTIVGSKVFLSRFLLPKNLKEDILAEVAQLHDNAPGKQNICGERSLVVSYNHCVYE